MNPDDYQLATHRTAARYRDADVNALVHVVGLCGEAGEVAEVIKKIVGHNHPVDHAKIAKELGDLMWYVSEVATDWGLKLSDIMDMNIAKLKDRYPEKFSSERSINRQPEE